MAVNDPGAVKPGYKTTEFWLTAAAQGLSLLFASGAIHAGTALGQVLGVVAMALTAAGYAVSRGIAKSGK